MFYIPQPGPTRRKPAEYAQVPGENIDDEWQTYREELAKEFPYRSAEWLDEMVRLHFEDRNVGKRIHDESQGAVAGINTTPDDEARTRQGREKGMKPLRTDKRVPAGKDGKPSRDTDFLDEGGPEEWNRSRRL